MLEEDDTYARPSVGLLLSGLRAPPRLIALYLAVYLPVGFFMNGVGQALEIAEFANWWQVLTCYGLYMVPCSLLIRHRHWFDQYLFGLLALGLLELAGYSLGTSIAHPGNVLDAVFTERNFALSMVLWFGLYLPAGNLGVGWLARKLGIH